MFRLIDIAPGCLAAPFIYWASEECFDYVFIYGCESEFVLRYLEALAALEFNVAYEDVVPVSVGGDIGLRNHVHAGYAGCVGKSLFTNVVHEIDSVGNLIEICSV